MGYYSSCHTPAAAPRRFAWRKRLPGWTLVCIVTIAVSGCGGCGGGDRNRDQFAQWGGMSKEEWLKRREEKQKKEKEEEEAARKKAEEEKKAKEEAAKEQAEEKAAERAKRNRNQQQTEPEDQAKPEEPPRPEAFSDWQQADFLKARILDDPRLAPAVEYYGQQHVGDEAAAELLAQLLKPRVLADLRDQIASKRGEEERLGQRHAFLIETIVAALGANGTAKARQTLQGVIDGSFRTELDKTAAEAALKALVDHPSPEHEDILDRVLTSAEQMRPPGQGEVTADALRKRAVALLKTGASTRFRVRLAQRLIYPGTPAELRQVCEQIIQEPTPANFEAHVVLYPSNEISASLKGAIERQFVQYGSESIGYLLSFPAQRNRMAPTPDWPYRVAEKLWSPAFQNLIDARLQVAKSLAESDQVVMLASTIPTTAMRSLLLKTLARNWIDGPGPLRAAGLAGDVIHEPGFCVVVKMLLRNVKVGSPEITRTIPKGRSNGLANLVKERQQRDAKVQADWERASEDLLKATGLRLREIGEAHADQMRREGRPVDFSHVTGNLPIELPADANVVAAVSYSWPAGIAEKVPGVLHSPMEIHYLRIEATAEPAKLAGLYRRKLTGYDSRNVQDGVWFDSLTAGSSPDRRRSVDIVVRLAKPDPLRLPNEAQELSVDILAIELTDPAGEQ